MLKKLVSPIDWIIEKITNHKVECLLWGCIVRWECKHKGKFVQVENHPFFDGVECGMYYNGWLLTPQGAIVSVPQKYVKG